MTFLIIFFYAFSPDLTFWSSVSILFVLYWMPFFSPFYKYTTNTHILQYFHPFVLFFWRINKIVQGCKYLCLGLLCWYRGGERFYNPLVRCLGHIVRSDGLRADPLFRDKLHRGAAIVAHGSSSSALCEYCRLCGTPGSTISSLS